MAKLSGKKLLVLGGKPIGSREIVAYARREGAYAIVADYLPKEQSPAKQIADESWEISTADLETLGRRIAEEQIDGVYTGVHEFNIGKMIELCEHLQLPCYCTKSQWDTLNNKREFKKICQKHGIPVTREFRMDALSARFDIKESDYPVVVKPVDGSGSRGFSLCHTEEALRRACEKAVSFSKSGEVLIEQYMDYKNSVIANYTVVNGEVFYSGLADKQSEKITENGAPVMSVEFYPSRYERQFLETLDGKIKRMLQDTGIQNGALWMEIFCDGHRFTMNEAGFRFGGSMTCYPVYWCTGIDQLALQVDYALLGKNGPIAFSRPPAEASLLYCVLPVHVKPGKIARIEGVEELQNDPELKHIVYVHACGDEISDWGSAQQVFAYIHFVADGMAKAEAYIDRILEKLHVLDAQNRELLFNLYRASQA